MISEFEKEIKKHFTSKEVDLILKAYHFADKAHMGQKRKSGEPYIIHPIHVAYLLMVKFHLYDANAVAAALLHDTIEDTDTTFEDLVANFNQDIANLVLGVTDTNNITFKNKTAEERFNNAAILRNMLKDFRIIYIKSADRFHNMSTLEYQDETRRLNKSQQTLGFYVPLNYGIGALSVARELEDLCFRYIFPDEYYKTLALKQKFEYNHQQFVENVFSALNQMLINSGIRSKINMRMKNVAGIYNSMYPSQTLEAIPDIINIQVVVDSKENCYNVLNLLKGVYKLESIKNYLACPNFNGYRGLDLIVTGKPAFKISIFTKSMEETNEYGYATISNRLKGKNNQKLQQIIANGSNFYSALKAIGDYQANNKRLLKQVEDELFKPTIMIHTIFGDFRFPENSTVLDIIHYYFKNDIDSIERVYVNGNLESKSFVLKDGDKVLFVKKSNFQNILSSHYRALKKSEKK